MEHPFGLIALGFVLGAFGTLIGAGGGFVLLPLYPLAGPETITCISLAVVFFNALSGSYAYARVGRIDYKAGLLFAAATIPGAIIGAMATDYVPRRLFDAVFGVLMAAAAVYVFASRPTRGLVPRRFDYWQAAQPRSHDGPESALGRGW